MSLYDEFNIAYLDAICLHKYPQFKNEIFTHAKSFNISKYTLFAYSYFIGISSFAKKCLRRIKRRKGEVKRFYGVKEISDAVSITMAELKEIVH